MEFIDGCLMRDIILKGNLKDIGDCSYSAGIHLNQLRHVRLTQSGFFDKKLKVIPFSKKENYLSFITSCLEATIVRQTIGDELANKIIIAGDHLQLSPTVLSKEYFFTDNQVHSKC